MNATINHSQHRTTLYTPRFAVPAFVAWAIAGLTGTPVSANPIYVSAFASVTSPGGQVLQNTGQLIGQTATTAEVSFNGAGQNSSAMVRAEMGSLGVRVFAGSAGFTAGAVAVGIATFSDDLLIASETLPLGTPVSVRFSMDLKGTTVFDSFSSLPSNTGLDSSIFLIGQVSGWGARTYHELHRYGRAVSVTGDPSFTVDSTVGSTLTLVGTLDINVRSDFQPGASSALSDYLNSARFFVAADSPEVSLVSASGHDYAVIPEPEHYALAVGGALGLFGLWRRYRRTPGCRRVLESTASVSGTGKGHDRHVVQTRRLRILLPIIMSHAAIGIDLPGAELDAPFTRITNGVLVTESAMSVSAAWGDFGNDGWLDLFVTCDPPTVPPPTAVKNRLYHNQGDGTFVKVTTGKLVTDSAHAGGAAWGDYDNDGFPDVFIANGTVYEAHRNALYRNHANSNAWIKLKCIGTLSNRSAIGTKIRLKATIGGREVWQMRQISGGEGWLGFNSLDVLIGLGDASVIDLLRLEWPSGVVQEISHVPVKETLELVEPIQIAAAQIPFTEPETVGLRLTGATGRPLRVAGSSDLVLWSALELDTQEGDHLSFRDTEAAAAPYRFYRVRVP